MVKEHIEQIKRLSAQSSNILYLSKTRDPEVSDKSSTASAVPPQPDEAPLDPSPPPGVGSPNSSEGAAATPANSPQGLRTGTSLNIGKPVLRLAKPRGAKSAARMTPPYSKRAGGGPAPFRSAAAGQPDEKRGRLATPAFRGQPAKVQPTKLSAKLPKVGNRKVQDKKAKRPSGDDLSDW